METKGQEHQVQARQEELPRRYKTGEARRNPRKDENRSKKRNEAKLIEKERRNKLIEEKKLKQEKMLRQEQEKRDKIIKKKMLEERWEMTKWITKYIDVNEDKWAREKKRNGKKTGLG